MESGVHHTKKAAKDLGNLCDGSVASDAFEYLSSNFRYKSKKYTQICEK